jgi:hypothetical protein
MTDEQPLIDTNMMVYAYTASDEREGRAPRRSYGKT